MAERRTVYPDPSEVAAKEGAVEVEGPDEVAVALTPEAAEQTSERLEKESIRARGQRRLKDLPHRPKR